MDEDHNDQQTDTLLRENAYLLRIIGGLGTVVLLLAGGFLSFWIGTVASRGDTLQQQQSRIWDVIGQRSDRIAALEGRLTSNDTITFEAQHDIRALMKDVQRMKSRLKIED